MKKNERTGLIIIAASLIVIVLIIALLFSYQQKTQETQIRSQGLSLTRLLAGMTIEQLTPVGNRQQNILQLINYRDINPELVYISVESKNGKRLNQFSTAGVTVPDWIIPTQPSAWIDEKRLILENTGQEILEYHAPVLSKGELQAYVRLGLTIPGFGLNMQQIPFFATIAFPIFLLVPLFYFLLRREIRPLHLANQEIESIMKTGQIQQVQVHASGELGEFMNNLNGFIQQNQARIQELEQNRDGLVTSAKLLSYQRARVENVLQSMPDGVLIIDETGVINFANAKISNLLGVDEGDLVGKKPMDWCTDPDVLAFFVKTEGARAPSYSAETIEFSPKNALEKDIQVSSYPLFSPKDTSAVFGTLIIFRDVTVEKLAKKSRGEFVAHVAHELKTPLNVLAMYSEALQGEEGKDESFRVEAINVIGDEVERLSTLISNLLSLTKIEMGSLNIERQRTKFRDLLEDTLNNVSRSGRELNLQFRLDLPKEISPLSIDKDLLRVAINNLLTNAIKYNKPGGSVTLSAEETGDAIMVAVSDTGIGIAEKDLGNIFEKFYRSDDAQVRERTGHGLGLSLARDIVHLHNGNLMVKSTLGEGTEFVIEIKKSTGLVKQAI